MYKRIYLVLFGLVLLSIVMAVPTLFAESWLVIDLSRLARAALLPIAALILIDKTFWKTRLFIQFYLVFYFSNFIMAFNDELFGDSFDGQINKLRMFTLLIGSTILAIYYYFKGMKDGNK